MGTTDAVWAEVPPRTPRSTPIRPGLVAAVAAVAAALLALAGRGPVAVAAPLLGALVVAVLARWAPQVSGRLHEWMAAASSAVAGVVAALAMVPAAILVTLLWASRRVVGLDALPTGAGWTRPAGGPTEPTRLHGPPVPSSSSGHRARAAAGVGIVGAALLAVVVLAAVVAAGSLAADVPTSAAFRDDPLFDRVWAEQQGFSRHVRFDPVSVHAYDDFTSEFVNQVDGVRRSWRPPACECRRLRVWWFGGSAAWGFFQADDESPPSQLARAAWEQGIALDIENRAVPGYTLGQEVMAFTYLSSRLDPPDVVVFYDGANDLEFQLERSNDGRGGDESPVGFYDDLVAATFHAVERVVVALPNRGRGEPAPDPEPVTPLLPEEIAGHAIARYGRDVALARRVAESVDTVPFFVWQPTQATSPPEVFAPFTTAEPWREGDLRFWRGLAADARRLLPDGVIDLAGAFDGMDEPIVPDEAHTNTRGAEIVGRELARRLEPDLARLAGVTAPGTPAAGG